MQSLSNNHTAQSIIKEWRSDSAKCITDIFNCELEPWQLKVCSDFDKHNKIAMKACKGPGKTFMLAALTWAFAVTRPNAEIMALSITSENLRDNLWKELGKFYSGSELLQKLFIFNKERITQRDNEKTWFIAARSYAKDADESKQSSSVAGFHPVYGMTILDECGDMSPSIKATVEASLTGGEEVKVVIAGNPTSIDGLLYSACELDGGKYAVTEINSDPENPERSRRVSVEWAQEQIDKWGRESSYVKINILGKFPSEAQDTLLTEDEVRQASLRHGSIHDTDERRIGVDVARQGDDRTVIMERIGNVAYMPLEMRGIDSVGVADRVYRYKAERHTDMELIDGTGGYGAGVVDNLVRLGLAPVEIHFSSKASDVAFLNKRSEMWFRMAEWIKNGGCIPRHTDLLRELTCVKVEYRNGKMRIEEKDSIKKRLGFSPDIADALALTFALPDIPKMAGTYHAITE
jgi:phage terminase large subunit